MPFSRKKATEVSIMSRERGTHCRSPPAIYTRPWLRDFQSLPFPLPRRRVVVSIKHRDGHGWKHRPPLSSEAPLILSLRWMRALMIPRHGTVNPLLYHLFLNCDRYDGFVVNFLRWKTRHALRGVFVRKLPMASCAQR